MSESDRELTARQGLSGSSGTSERSDLIRGLGLWSATAIVIGDTIGTGIFLVTSDMARAVGTATLVFAAWIIGGLLLPLCPVFFAGFGPGVTGAGGPYVLLKRST